ncbi:MAG: RDD family protein [Alphaproteobacteria bacterium]|nr:RDD family protein [Alphaproteobacteria bacterium]
MLDYYMNKCVELGCDLHYMIALSILATLATFLYTRQKKQACVEPKKGSSYSSFRRRFFAGLLDAIFIGILSFIITFVLTFILSFISSLIYMEYPQLSFNNFIRDYLLKNLHIFSQILGYMVGLSYIVLQLHSKYQATIGMRILGIKLYNSNLTKPNIWVILGRELSVYFLTVITLGIAGLMIIWTRRKQSLYDKVSRTVVCREW